VQSRLTRRISAGIAGMAGVVGLLNLLTNIFLVKLDLVSSFGRPQVWVLFVIAILISLAGLLKEIWAQSLHVFIILLLSGPMLLSSPSFTFFGMWFFVLGNILMYKYGFLNRAPYAKLTLVSGYFLPFLAMSILQNEGGEGSITRVADYLLFLLMSVVFLYFIFEEQIRDLLAANTTKETALAEKDSVLAGQADEIARMEPLSVLGERVSHVTHSFKNNLTQLDAIVGILEDTNDAQRGAGLLSEVSHTLNERIDNILMVSRAGVDLEPETFDAARVLEGMKFIYLSEPSFVKNVWHEMNLRGPVMIRAVRWDFILMVENILKNALDAIHARGVRGIVRIDLSAGLLTVSNNGGAMERCSTCIGNCLDCPLYGRPGRTTKVGGTGHGLAQVFSACRKNGWALRIRTEDEWTRFQILLTVPESRVVGSESI